MSFRQLFQVITGFCVIVTGSVGMAAPGVLLQEYADPVHQNNGWFGYSVAGYGSNPLVGEPLRTGGGAVYMYNAGQTNTPIQTITAPNSIAPVNFGITIATTGSRILIADQAAGPTSGTVTAPQDPVEATPDAFRGAVVLYESNVDPAPRTFINPVFGQGYFGDSLALSATGKFAVGDSEYTSGTEPMAGRVYMYDGSTTTPQMAIDNPAPFSGSKFGKAVDFFDDMPNFAAPLSETSYQGALVVGAPGLSAVFEYDVRTGDLLNILQSPNSSTDGFGTAVATAGTKVIVGAPNTKFNNQFNAGAVYIMDRASGELIRTLSNPTQASGAFFGISLAVLDNKYVVVGVNPGTGTTYGNVRVFDLDTGALVSNLTSPNTKRPNYGYSVAVAGANIVVGDYQGASDAPTGQPGRAYLFGGPTTSITVPAAPTNLTATPMSESSIFLTFQDNSSDELSFTMERRRSDEVNFTPIATLAANATSYTDTGLTSGTQYFYRVKANNAAGSSGYSNVANATTPVDEQPDLTGQIPNPGAAGDRFGFSMAALGKARLVVGAPYADGTTTDSGKVYVYTPPALTPSLTLTNPAPLTESYFGYSVAGVGENILVGAPGTESTFSGGAAYLFNGQTGALIYTYHDPSGQPGKQFGFSVSGNGTAQALIGAPGAGPLGNQPGSASLFDAKKTGALLQTLNSATSAPQDRFGVSVAGGKKNAAIVAENPGGQTCTNGAVELWALKKGLFLGASTNATVVAAAKGGFIVGADLTTDCSAPGNGYAYLLRGTALSMSYMNPTSDTEDAFGAAVSGGKKFNAVGAPLFDAGVDANVGRAYLFSPKLSTPTRTYDSPSPDANDQFGASLALPGKNYFAVGAPLDDTFGTDAGAVFLYTIPKK